MNAIDELDPSTANCRLSEDPTVTVAVLEAGKNQDDLDAVKIPGKFGYLKLAFVYLTLLLGFMGQTQGSERFFSSIWTCSMLIDHVTRARI